MRPYMIYSALYHYTRSCVVNLLYQTQGLLPALADPGALAKYNQSDSWVGGEGCSVGVSGFYGISAMMI